MSPGKGPINHEIRWEESPGLYHGCGVCGACLNSPKAKKTCYGKHAEPCIRYHRTMFVKGDSHKCESCRKSNGQHEKRHRAISALVCEIKELDGELSADRKAKETHSYEADGDSDESNALSPAVRSENPGNNSEILEEGQENEQEHQTPALRRQLKRAAKFERSVAKARKRQQQNLASGVVKPDLNEPVSEAIHGSLKVLPTMLPEEGNVILHKIIDLCENLDSEMRKQTSKSGKEYQNKADLEYIQDVLRKLGVRTDVNSSSRDRKLLVQKLADGIFADIEQIANEAREILKRKAAYFKFANKGAYNAMVKNNQFINWETGEKLAIDDDENELGSISTSAVDDDIDDIDVARKRSLSDA